MSAAQASITALAETIRNAARPALAPAQPVTLQAVQDHLERSARFLEDAADCFDGLKLTAQAAVFRKQAHQTRHLIVRIGA